MLRNTLIITVLLSFTVSAFGQSRSSDIKKIERYANEIQSLSPRFLPKLSDAEIASLKNTLEQARNTLLGRGGSTPPQRVCLHDPFGGSAAAQKTIQDAAQDYLGMFKFDAEDHAQEWMGKYPCSLAQDYADNAQALFETAREVFDLFKFDAEKFALENVEKLCDSKSLRKTAQGYYDLGRSRGMFSNEAEEYAQTRVAKDGFYTCQFGK